MATIAFPPTTTPVTTPASATLFLFHTPDPPFLFPPPSGASLRLPVGIPSYSLAFNRKVMPQLRPAGRGVAFDGAADRPAELNFNYRVLSTLCRSETKRCAWKNYVSPSRADSIQPGDNSGGISGKILSGWVTTKCCEWCLYLNDWNYLNWEGIKLMNFPRSLMEYLHNFTHSVNCKVICTLRKLWRVLSRLPFPFLRRELSLIFTLCFCFSTVWKPYA